ATGAGGASPFGASGGGSIHGHGNGQAHKHPHVHGGAGGVRVGERKSTKRSRSFLRLFGEFWELLSGHHATLIAALCTLSVSTLLGLIPLYAPKLVFDN